MLIYRIFLGFCGVCLCVFFIFFFILFLFPKRALLTTLATPPHPLVQTRPSVLSSRFFALRRNSFHSRLYWSGVSSFRCPLPLPHPPGGLDVTVASCSRPPPHHRRHRLSCPSASSPPSLEILAVFPCFDEVPVIYRDNFHRSETESPPPTLRFISSPTRIRRSSMVLFCWRDGSEMKAAAHRGAFPLSEVFLKLDWYKAQIYTAMMLS